MTIHIGDHIRYNFNFFNGRPALILDTPVAEIVTQDTGYGEYTEFKTVTGDWVSELQLIDE